MEFHPMENFEKHRNYSLIAELATLAAGCEDYG